MSSSNFHAQRSLHSYLPVAELFVVENLALLGFLKYQERAAKGPLSEESHQGICHEHRGREVRRHRYSRCSLNPVYIAVAHFARSHV